MHVFAYPERKGVGGTFLAWIDLPIRSVLTVLLVFGSHGHLFEVFAPFLSYAAAPQHFPSWMRLPSTADARIVWTRHRVFCFDRLANARPPQSAERLALPSPGATSDWPRVTRVLLRICEQDRCNHVTACSRFWKMGVCLSKGGFASPFRLHRHFGPRPASPGAVVMGKVVGTIPFCRARSEAD